jgi:hypothetical protein
MPAKEVPRFALALGTDHTHWNIEFWLLTKQSNVATSANLRITTLYVALHLHVLRAFSNIATIAAVLPNHIQNG